MSGSEQKVVFISHSSHDKPFVRQLSDGLSRHGISSWVDEAELHFGDSLVQKISDAIEHISLVLAVISEHSVNSSWVRQELEWAMTKEIKNRRVVVIPIVIQKCDIPFFLSNKLYADFTNADMFEATVERLVGSIRHQQGAGYMEPSTKPFGANVAIHYKPTIIPIVVNAFLLAFALVLFIFPAVSMVYPFDKQKNALVCTFLRGASVIIAACAFIDFIRIALVRYMMRVDPNFAHEAAHIRIGGLLFKKYRSLIWSYRKYHMVKLLVFLEVVTFVAIIMLAQIVLQMASYVL